MGVSCGEHDRARIAAARKAELVDAEVERDVRLPLRQGQLGHHGVRPRVGAREGRRRREVRVRRGDARVVVVNAARVGGDGDVVPLDVERLLVEVGAEVVPRVERAERSGGGVDARVGVGIGRHQPRVARCGRRVPRRFDELGATARPKRGGSEESAGGNAGYGEAKHTPPSIGDFSPPADITRRMPPRTPEVRSLREACGMLARRVSQSLAVEPSSRARKAKHPR